MSRMYVISWNLESFTGNGALAAIAAVYPDTANEFLVVHSFRITQDYSSPDSPQVEIEWRLGGTVTGGGVVTTVVAPYDPGDPAFSGVARQGVSLSVAGDVIGASSFALGDGFRHIFLPEDRPVVVLNKPFYTRIPTTVSTRAIYYEIVFEEIG